MSRRRLRAVFVKELHHITRDTPSAIARPACSSSSAT